MRFHSTTTAKGSPATELKNRFPAALEALANIAAGELAWAAPEDTGTLSRILGESVHRLGGGVFGVGSFDDLGSDPDDTPPRGTIADFLDKFEHFRNHGEGGFMFPWHDLGNAEFPHWAIVDILDKHRRLMGQFGGVAGKAPYWHVVDVGSPGPMAGVEGRNYIERATKQVEAAEKRVFDRVLGAGSL